MTKEEAGQIVLEGKPWVPCEVCNGRGKALKAFVTPMGRTVYDSTLNVCWYCEGKGYKLPDTNKLAYELANVHIPEKPPTPIEFFAKTIGDGIKRRINTPSLLRQILPPQLIPDEDLEKYKKGTS